MLKHIINKEDLQDFTRDVQLGGAYGEKQNKSLYMRVYLNTNTQFIVLDHRKEVLTTNNLDEAIEFYNSL